MKCKITCALVFAIVVNYFFAEDKKIVIQLPIVVIVCSYNNSQWYEKNLDSIFMQKYSNYHVIYTDDCSTDATGALVKSYIKKYNIKNKITFIQNKNRKYQLYNTWCAVHACDDRVIIMIVDGDDWLAHDMVMQRINQEYQNPNVWLTYGQFQEYPSGKMGFCRKFPNNVVIKKLYRKHHWISSHLRTFNAGLFKRIRKEDFMLNGEFFKAGADLAAMFPMLEMANGRMKCISDVLYIYNRVRSRMHKAAVPSHQRIAERELRSYKKVYDSIKEIR